MRLHQRLLSFSWTQRWLAWLVALYIRLVYFTSRKRVYVDAAARPYFEGTRNGIFAFWHGRMMMCPAVSPRARPMRVLVSLHRDGRFLARVIAHFKLTTICGSSNKGGSRAVIAILRALRIGDSITLAPDGPRGPAQVAAKGIVTVAQLSQKPVVPVACSGTHVRRLRSWDRFLLVLPFGRIVFCVGPPIRIDRRADASAKEGTRLRIERTLDALSERADRLTQR